jgi:hypothetical protein
MVDSLNAGIFWCNGHVTQAGLNDRNTITVVSKINVYVLFFFGEGMKSEVARLSMAAVNIGH